MIDFNQLKKNGKKSTEGFKSIKIAVLADSASQLVCQAIRGYGIEYKTDYRIFEADYNQIDRQVFDPSSELYSYQPDFVLIFRSTEKLLRSFYTQDIEGRASFAEEQLAYTKQLCQTINAGLKTTIIINTFPEMTDGVFGNYATQLASSFTYQVKKTNIVLMDISREIKNLFLFDLASLVSIKGYEFIFDPKVYVSSDMAFSIDALPYIAKNIHGIIQSIEGNFKKCLILDLDNTTWGGIIGDDGMEGIEIGGLGRGKIFTELQYWAKELIKRGIIVAVCSKNTEAIAKEPFISHPDMVLRLEDIAVFVANWENKVDNIRYIQTVLNIGFDSMVFLDDNPFEREMVKQDIPELTVPSLPEDPAEYLLYIKDQNLFETASYTEEDSARTTQYREEAKRSIVQKSFTNEADFLASLQMSAAVASFNSFTIPRVAQLSQRSNQFNLRTVRYTEENIAAIASSGNYFTASFTLKDIYGDYGLISFIILEIKDKHTLFIDSWIMSCRVLKRGMEQLVLAHIIEIAKANGYTTLIGQYIPTQKNGLVKEHYAQLGFMPMNDNYWKLELNGETSTLNIKTLIKKNEH